MPHVRIKLPRVNFATLAIETRRELMAEDGADATVVDRRVGAQGAFSVASPPSTFYRGRPQHHWVHLSDLQVVDPISL
jgi:hypothetical protein